MDTLGEWLLLAAVVFAVLLVVGMGIALFVGSNERGNDDHELDEYDEERHA